MLRIDIEKSEEDGHRVFINPSYDETGKLEEARQGMDGLLEKLPELLEDAADTLKMSAQKDVKLDKDNKGEYFFASTRKKDKAIRAKKSFQVCCPSHALVLARPANVSAYLKRKCLNTYMLFCSRIKRGAGVFAAAA